MERESREGLCWITGQLSVIYKMRVKRVWVGTT